MITNLFDPKTRKKRKRFLFSALFAGFSTFGVVLLGALLRAGYQYIGDGEIFVFRDNLLSFLTILAICYLAGLSWCAFSMKLPRYDYIGRIVAINIFIYSLLGLSLSWLRIPLYSRTLVLSEFILSTILILLFIYLRNRLFPAVIGTFSTAPHSPIGAARYLKWVKLEKITTNVPHLDAVASEPGPDADPEQMQLIADLSQKGVTVFDRRHLETLLTGRIKLDELSLNEFDNFSPQNLYTPIKRILDIVITLLMAPFLILITLIVAFLVRADSHGPIFFCQERVGFRGKRFTLYKFRSMYMSEASSRTQFAEKDDARITRIGRLLRTTRLDELPQFWNVLKGDMSIIGPRPEQIEFADRFSRVIPYYGFRHTVYPGITGWAQTMHGYAANEHQTREKLEYDFFYLRNFSVWLDLIICFRTLEVLALRKGAR